MPTDPTHVFVMFTVDPDIGGADALGGSLPLITTAASVDQSCPSAPACHSQTSAIQTRSPSRTLVRPWEADDAE